MRQHALRGDFGVASLLAVTERLLLLGPVTPNVVLDGGERVFLSEQRLWPSGSEIRREARKPFPGLLDLRRCQLQGRPVVPARKCCRNGTHQNGCMCRSLPLV